MNQILLEKINELREEINNSPEITELNRLNNLMENDDEVMKLCYAKDIAVTKYEDALRFFGENSDEVRSAQKALHNAKLALDLNELVIKYKKQYEIVNEMYTKINKELFEPFK